jgi:hypothetical protein
VGTSPCPSRLAHYYAEAGTDGFTFVPPVILFRPQAANPFKKQIARIAIGGYDDRSSEDDKWLLKLAKGYAAGGECLSVSLLRFITKETDPTESGGMRCAQSATKLCQ